MKGIEYPALLKQYKTLLDQKDNTETYGRQIWVLYAIALSQANDAKAFIEELLKIAEDSPNPVNMIGVGIGDIQFLMSVAEKRLAKVRRDFRGR
jgi:hypothetical protein